MYLCISLSPRGQYREACVLHAINDGGDNVREERGVHPEQVRVAYHLHNFLYYLHLAVADLYSPLRLSAHPWMGGIESRFLSLLQS